MDLLMADTSPDHSADFVCRLYGGTPPCPDADDSCRIWCRNPYCEAQVGGMECGRPVARHGHQCEKHDPEGVTRRAHIDGGESGE